MISRIRPAIADLLRLRKFSIGFGILSFIIAFSLIGPLIYTVDPLQTFIRDSPPTPEHPLGTDSLGRDLLAQMMAGTRTSLYIGIVASLIGVAIGSILGLIAGYKGGFVDILIELFSRVIMVKPTLVLLILIMSFIKIRDPIIIAVFMGVFGWPGLTLAIRGLVMSIKTREYIYMSRIAGLGTTKIVLEDILPNMMSYISANFIRGINGAILGEVGLSIIGLGATQGVSIGRIFYIAQQFEAIRRGLWWDFIFPGIVLVSLSLSLLLIATALDEYFNPRLRE